MRTHHHTIALIVCCLLLGTGATFGQATKFVITGSSSQVAGTTQNLTIRADSAGSPAATYTGAKVLTFSGANSSSSPVTAPTISDATGTPVAFGSPTTITFVDGLATVTGANNGVLSLYYVESAVISATDGSIQSTGADRLTIAVSAGNFEKFAFALASPQINNAAFTGTNTLTAQDSWGNTVTTFNAASNHVSISVNSLGGVVVGLGSGDNNILNKNGDFSSGVADLTAAGMRYVGPQGTGSFTATSAGPAKSGSSSSVTINPGIAKKLVMTGSATQMAGTSQTPTITAKDTSGNTATGYTGSKNLTYSGASSVVSPATSPTASTSGGSDVAFGSITSVDFVNGVATASGANNGTLKLYKVESATISVTDGTISTGVSDRLTVSVTPGTVSKFAVAIASPQTSGVAFTGTNTVTAQDSWSNTVTGFDASASPVTMTSSLTGTIEGLGSLNTAVLNQAADFSSGVANLTTQGMIFTGASGSGTFTATSTSPAATGTSGSVTINAGTATRLVITGQSTQTAGTSQNLTITAKDASNNTVAGYTGLKTLTFSGASSSTDPVTTPKVRNATGTDVAFGTATSITFTNGVATVSSGNNGVLKLYKAESPVIAVTDGSINSQGADRLSVIVSAGDLGKFAFIAAATQQNNVPFTGTNTLTAQDDWGNIITTYSAATNPVTVTVAGLTGTVLGLGSGANNVLNQAGDFTSGQANLTGLGMKYLGTSGSGAIFTATSTSPAKSGTTAAVTITPGIAKRFALSGSATVAAGVANPLTITAQDTSGNTATGYSGGHQLAFSGADASPDANAPTVTSNTGSERNFSGTPNTDITFTNGVAAPSGNSNGVMRLRKVEIASIAVSDGTISTPPGAPLGVTVTPAGLGRFNVVMTSPQTNGVAFEGVNTITAIDSFGNTATGFSPASNNVTVTTPSLGGAISGLGSGLNNVLNQVGDFIGGVANVSLKLKYTGVIGSSTVKATSANGKEGTSSSVTINVGTASRLVITGNGSQGAGTLQSLTITAMDSSNNTVTTYTGGKTLLFSGSGPSPDPQTPPTVTTSGGTAVPFGIGTSITFASGVATASGSNNGAMRLFRAGRDTIAVSDGSIGSGGPDRLIVNVSADALAKFAFALSSPQQSGVAFTGTNTLTAQDSYGNIKTDFNASTDNVTVNPSGLPGTVSGLGSGTNNVLNQATDFSSGVANLTGKMKFTGQIGTGLFTAASASSKVGTSNSVQIVAGGATRLVVRLTAGDSVTTLTAGGTTNLKITATDASGNPVTTYTGAKSLTFSGADSSLSPAAPPTVTNGSGSAIPFGAATSITFTNGIATVSGSNNGVLRLLRAQTALVAVTDGTLKSTGNDCLTVTVSPSALGKFGLAIATPQTNGAVFTGTNALSALDDWGNTVTTFSAATTPVTMTTTLSGTIAGLGSGGNNILNRAADFTSGVANLTTLGMKYTGNVGTGTFTAAGGGKNGVSGSVQIVAGGATRLVLRTALGDSVTTMTAGTTKNLVITAKDGSGNTVTTYSGAKTLRFDGADSSTAPATAPTVSNSSGIAIAFRANTSITFTNGVAQVGGSSNGVLKLYRAQNATVTVTDGSISSNGNDALAVTTAPSVLGKFRWALASPQVSGVAFSGVNTLTAQDDWGNTVTTFDASASPVTVSTSLAGAIGGLGTGNNEVMNRNSDFSAGVANLTTLGMKYTGAVGTGVFTATSGGKAGTSDSVVISAGSASRLVLTGAGTQIAGTAQNLTITARDVSNNIVTSYTGPKSLTFSGPASATNPVTAPTISDNGGSVVAFTTATPITFTNGVASVVGSTNGVMRLYRVENAIISVTDGSISSLGSDRLTVNVQPGALGQFAWTLASPQVNSVAFAGTNTLIAQDDWGNTVPTFNASTNNVTITTTFPGSPQAITGLGSLGNNVLNQAGNFTSGIANLTTLGIKYTGAAGTGTFTATSAVGSKTGTSAVITMNNPVPTLTAVSPGEASRLQKITVGLTGTNFMTGVTTVNFGGNVTADSTFVDSPTHITAQITVGDGAALGLRNVSVANPAPGGGTGSLASAFRVKNVPNLVSLNPVSGIRGQTLDVDITGTNFASGTSTVGILGANITLNSQTVVSPTVIRVNITISLGASDGVRYFTVTNSGTEGGVSNQLGFTVGNNPAPTVASVKPDTVARQSTVDLTLRGTEFFNGITTVNFGSGITINSTAIDSSTAMRVNVTVTDTAAAGLRNVTVTNAAPGGGNAVLSNKLLIANPVPTFTGISVQNGARLQTMTMQLTGTKFVKGVTLANFGGGITVNTIAVDNPTQITVDVTIDSSAALGVRSLSVSNPAPGGGTAQLANALTVNNPRPTVTSIAPESTLVGGGPLAMVVTGTNFVPGSTVRLGNTAIGASLIDRTRLDVSIPAAELDTARTYTLTVVNSAPGGDTSNSKIFTVQNPAPTLASVTPAQGSRLAILDVVFDGTNFVPGVTTVNFGGTDITVDAVTFNSATRLTARVTISASATIGPRDVTVANPAPGGGTSENRTFTVANNPVPTILTVVPNAGSRLSKDTVVINGTNFINGVTSVDFGAGITVAGTPVINSASRLTAVITIGVNAATGPRAVAVTNAAPGGGTATKTGGFTVNNPAPTLISISPSNMQQLTTKNVVFTGSGFIDGVSTVNLGTGITINTRSVVSDTQITANVTVTALADTGPRDVWVTNLTPGGGTAVLTNGFVVGNNPPPVFTSVTPSTATRLQTLDLRITGNNFIGGTTSLDMGSDMTVNNVTVDSSTGLTANVTIRGTTVTGARTIYLTNAAPGGGRDSITNGFTVTNPLPALSSATPSEAVRNQTIDIVLRGGNFVTSVTTANFGSGIVVNSVVVDSVSRIRANITIGASAALGARNVVVNNPAPGGGNSPAIAFTVNLAAPPAPTLVSPYNNQLNLPTTPTLRWDSSAGATKYRLRVSTKTDFSSTVVDDSNLTTTSRQIGALIDGVPHYWQVQARNSGGTSAYSPTWTFTPSYPGAWIVNKTWTFATYATPGEYKAADYQIVGLPGNGTAPVSTYLGGTQATDWQLYWDNGGTGNAADYMVLNSTAAPFVFSTGRAYWLVKKGPWTITNSSVTSSPRDNDMVLIPLHAGYNLITNPFGLDVPWSAVQQVNGSSASEQPWEFAGALGYVRATILKPCTGYYFINSDTLTNLKIPYAGTSGVLKTAVDTVAGWTMVLGVRTEEYADHSTVIGVRADASDGKDDRDYHRPRGFGDAPSLAIMRADLDRRMPAFAADIRAGIGSLSRWNLVLDARKGREVKLDADGLGAVPAEYEVYLVDHVHQRYTDLRAHGAYTFTPVADRSAFSVLIGSHEAVQRELGSVVPQTYLLEQNYPNPFNPSTTIPVSVPVTGAVAVKIYNILGEEIATLHDGVLEQGRHWLTWSGKNAAGQQVATGMYLTRLTTPAGGSQVVKMLLMK
jgi:hypothetical protein